jgi:hypothetical protein
MLNKIKSNEWMLLLVVTAYQFIPYAILILSNILSNISTMVYIVYVIAAAWMMSKITDKFSYYVLTWVGITILVLILMPKEPGHGGITPAIVIPGWIVALFFTIVNLGLQFIIWIIVKIVRRKQE